jgi:acyl-CoA thioesterase-1
MFKIFVVMSAGLITMGFTRVASAAEKMMGEPLVLAGDTPGNLLGDEIDPKSIVVRSTYLPGGTVYDAEKDFHFDPAARTIARTANSRIPDFSTNVLFGKKDFNQGEFPGYGNGKFFVYVDYEFEKPLRLTTPVDVTVLLPKTIEKLKSGEPMKVIAYGDSITAGGEASSPELQFPARYVEHLTKMFPQAKIALENGATGGDNTVNGLARLDEKVLTRSPDVVLVGFGMNDHNIPDVGGVAIPAFKKNLEQMVNRIREQTGAEVILLSAFPPNPQWHFSSHSMEKYAEATKAAAGDCKVAYADVFGAWKPVLERKDPSSLLANNINHPNDFGHWLYLQALEALTLQP